MIRPLPPLCGAARFFSQIPCERVKAPPVRKRVGRFGNEDVFGQSR